MTTNPPKPKRKKSGMKRDPALVEPVSPVVLPSGNLSLAEVQTRILAELSNGGSICGACGCRAAGYIRWLDHRTVYSGLTVYKEIRKPLFPHLHRGEWVHVKNLFAALPKAHKLSADYAFLSDWKMLEKHPLRSKEERKTGAPPSSGYWRMTKLGEDFFSGRSDAPHGFAYYQDQFIAFTKQRVTIHEALGERFNYAELMAGIPV